MAGMMPDLSTLTPVELLAIHAAHCEELRRRGLSRSSNNPVGDLAEYLFCKAFGWKQAALSVRDADATDNSGFITSRVSWVRYGVGPEGSNLQRGGSPPRARRYSIAHRWHNPVPGQGLYLFHPLFNPATVP